jgi:hypothetical protein
MTYRKISEDKVKKTAEDLATTPIGNPTTMQTILPPDDQTRYKFTVAFDYDKMISDGNGNIINGAKEALTEIKNMGGKIVIFTELGDKSNIKGREVETGIDPLKEVAMILHTHNIPYAELSSLEELKGTYDFILDEFDDTNFINWEGVVNYITDAINGDL